MILKLSRIAVATSLSLALISWPPAALGNEATPVAVPSHAFKDGTVSEIARKEKAKAVRGLSLEKRGSPAPAPSEARGSEGPPSPLDTPMEAISFRHNPLREAVYAIARTTGLNVVMQEGVDPETPVTAALNGVTVRDALDVILSSAGYFYTLKSNILVVSAYETKIFEIGKPSVIQQFSVNVGGDILGAARSSESGVAGEVTQKITSDSGAFKFWDMIEKSLKIILGTDTASAVAEGPATTLAIDRMTGTIMVTSTRNKLLKVERFISRIKGILDRQVVIEARIVEVSLTDGLKYGIDWSFLGRGIQGVGQVGAGTSKFTDLLSNAANFNFTIKGADFTSILRALKEQGDINVLSNPRINIMNGQTAVLSVGRKVDFISRVETTTLDTTAGTTPTVTFTVDTSSILSGIMFGLVPYIEDGGREVTLTITPVVSDLIKLEEKTIGNTGSNTVDISLPTVDLKELSTTVRVPSGEMVVIGGLMEKKDSTKDSSVPLLSKIPLVGPIFRSRDRNRSRTELVIMIRPVVKMGSGTRQ